MPTSPATWIPRFAGKRILVVGDLMLDEFVWGKVSRISPEAPVPVVNVTSESYYPGGAANVARNLREFTPHVAVMGRAGRDSAGDRLLHLLQADGIDTSGILRDPSLPTTVKTRVIARSQQVVRVDRERIAPLSAGQLSHAQEHLSSQLAEFDAVIATDYGKGFFSQPFADALCAEARARRTILTVDPHPHTSLVWRGVTAIKPNRIEAFNAAGMPVSEPVDPVLSDTALLAAGARLLRLWQTSLLLITLGEHGMLLLRESAPLYHAPARAKAVYDVSGAGDTAIAVLTLALAAGAPPTEAADLANLASGIVVGKVGTATITPEELISDSAAIA